MGKHRRCGSACAGRPAAARLSAIGGEPLPRRAGGGGTRCRRLVQLSGNEIDDVDQVRGQGGVTAHTGAELAVHRRHTGRGRQVLAGRTVMESMPVRSAVAWGEQGAPGTQPVQTVGLPCHLVGVDQTLGEHHLQQ